MKLSAKKLALVAGLGLAVLAGIPLFAAFEAHVINVTARIENALFVHPESLEYGTVFPQEHLNASFFVTFSQSFSESSQQRVGTVDYVIKQKPKPRVDTAENRDFCHNSSPANPANPQDPYYETCYPVLCPYLSKHPDNVPPPGNDSETPPFHDPNDPLSWTKGRIVKFPSINNDPGDIWTVDLAVPCFEGKCSQDWSEFVRGLNPDADPDKYKLPLTLESEIFGCDLWIEVTDIF